LLYTNHFALLNDKLNTQEVLSESNVTLTTLNERNCALNFYCDAIVTFNVLTGG